MTTRLGAKHAIMAAARHDSGGGLITKMSPAITDAQVLTTFLSVEGFLLATISLTATLGAPGRKRPAPLPVRAEAIAMGAAVLSMLVGAAGVAAWFGMYSEGSLLPPRQLLIAVVLLSVVVAQPVVAFLLALGARAKVD